MTRPVTHGLPVYVLRSALLGDCTAHGVSSDHDRLIVVGTLGRDDKYVTPLPVDSRVFAATDDAPAVAIRDGNLPGTLVIVPVQESPAGLAEYGYVKVEEWVMMGGNFADSADSRLSRVIESRLGHRFYGALPIHDRIER
jgi:hypothetical protein